MASIRVTHGIGDLTDDLKTIAKKARPVMARVVATNAREGNAQAKENASEDHTMQGDTDIEYPPSFTTERLGPLLWEYGPDSAIGDGSQASGYEFGSINSPAHFDLARSVDVIKRQFPDDVGDAADGLFWP